MSGEIYLLKFIDTEDKIIYKIGKTCDFKKRLRQYSFPQALITYNSIDINTDESNLIKLFNAKFKLFKGKEYFIHSNQEEVCNI